MEIQKCPMCGGDVTVGGKGLTHWYDLVNGINHMELLKRLREKANPILELVYDKPFPGKWSLNLYRTYLEYDEFEGDTPEQAIEAAAAHECVDLDMV